MRCSNLQFPYRITSNAAISVYTYSVFATSECTNYHPDDAKADDPERRHVSRN